MKHEDEPSVVTVYDPDTKMLRTRVRLSEVEIMTGMHELPLIVYGARCLWWDNIEGAALRSDNGLPCCPHCGSVLFQVEEATWWERVDGIDRETVPGYRKLVEWVRGKCFPSMGEAQRAYAREPHA